MKLPGGRLPRMFRAMLALVLASGLIFPLHVHRDPHRHPGVAGAGPRGSGHTDGDCPIDQAPSIRPVHLAHEQICPIQHAPPVLAAQVVVAVAARFAPAEEPVAPAPGKAFRRTHWARGPPAA